MEATEPSRPELRSTVETLCRAAFGPTGAGGPSVVAVTDINRGRGAFSEVLRAELDWPGPVDGQASLPRPGRPSTVVIKLPVAGPNGEAARASGAYRRESLAYRELLPQSPVDHPASFLVADDGDACSLVLEDLTDRRAVDQLDGLGPTDALGVASALARLHRAWSDPERLAPLPVRRNTLSGLPPVALEAGLEALADRWTDVLDDAQRSVYRDLVAVHAELAGRFEVTTPTLCHGDPRADNLVFDPTAGSPVLFDWQQMAIQPAEADLAWLAATSLTVSVRRSIERDLVAVAGRDFDRYRTGLALPGLAVLLLAQRELPTPRARRFVAVSLERIVNALVDNDTARAGHTYPRAP